MPEHLARLLCIIRTLLHFGHHLSAFLDRPAARRGFWLFSAMFGARRRAVMRASLHRGLLRAAALESLLLQRAATGRDVPPAPFAARAVPICDPQRHPCYDPFDEQTARLAAERAQFHAPADPNHLAAAEAVAAEVLTRSIGRTLDDIRRDLGVIAAICTLPFWDMLADASAGYRHGTAAECLAARPPAPEQAPPAPEPAPAPQPVRRGPTRPPRQRQQTATGKGRVIRFPAMPRLGRRRVIVPVSHRYAVLPPATTGPPPWSAMPLAA